MRRPIGISTFVWASPFSDREADALARRAKAFGFDVLEVCIEDPAIVTAGALRAAASEAEIGVSVCGAFGRDRDVSHENAEQRAQGIAYLKTCIDIAAATGSGHVAGPMYSATGQARLLPESDRERQRIRAAESLREVADYGGERGVALAIEPLNRFETDLVNTVDQGLDLCARIDRENVGLLIDTFHMNIEEKSVPDAIREAGEHALHVHACENDRGTPGSGHVDWQGVFAALEAIDYRRQIVIESFTPAIQEIARAVSMWRPLAPSQDDLARDGIAFLRRMDDAWRSTSTS